MERIHLSATSWMDKYVLPEEHLPSEAEFEVLWNLHPEKYNQVIMGGKVVDTPRWQQSYNLPYFFTGKMHAALPVPDAIMPYWAWVDALGYGKFKQILLNWYENGHHYIGAHSDNERQLVNESAIASISIGAERKFRIRDKLSKAIKCDVDMPNGTVFVMGGQMQTEFTHEVPKINGKKGDAVGRRINITFRQFRKG